MQDIYIKNFDSTFDVSIWENKCHICWEIKNVIELADWDNCWNMYRIRFCQNCINNIFNYPNKLI